jgi:hypothetical protein
MGRHIMMMKNPFILKKVLSFSVNGVTNIAKLEIRILD